MASWAARLFISALCFLSLPARADTYPDFAALALQEQPENYHIELVQRSSPVSVFAIHGGWIEPGTDRFATLLAAGRYNLYLFQATNPDHYRELHLTSTHFDEPRAVKLAQASVSCLSIHGYLERDRAAFCVGGADDQRAGRITAALAASNFEVIYPCVRFPGVEPSNIVNRCRSGGVQLEISTRLRDDFARSPELEQKAAAAILRSLP